jgi:Uma2 family endonuclease
MTVAEQVQAPTQQAPPVQVQNRLVLHWVDWTDYTKFLEAVGHHRVRLTYNRGTLEIMTVSGIHDWWKRRIGFLLPWLGALLNLKVQGYGHTTLRRRDVEQGLEPDEQFYIRHAVQVYGPRNIDLTQDPPPDLAIEIDISRSSLDRMAIYASLRIPEVWRFDGEILRIYHLQVDGTYAERERSLSFPTLPIPDFAQFLRQTENLSESELIVPFQAWARQHALPSAPDSANGP